MDFTSSTPHPVPRSLYMEKQAVELRKDEDGGEESLLQTVEQQRNWFGLTMCLFQGFWLPDLTLRRLSCFQKNFKPHDTDIVLASLPKAGTTWLKALLFSIINRRRFPIDQSPLLTTNPHRLVLSLEFNNYRLQDNSDLDSMNHPRLFATHLPHQVLPSSLINSKTKIVYISRNLLDLFISDQKFFFNVVPDSEPLPFEEAFDLFCRGTHFFGPFWEHVLGYWKDSLENPDRVLFLKYEDLKTDPISSAIKIAEFVGMPFSAEEEKAGLIGEISDLCSFEKLKNLEVNKSGVYSQTVANKSFFRKGEIGDWKNHLSPEMAEQLKQVVDEKMSGVGLML